MGSYEIAGRVLNTLLVVGWDTEQHTFFARISERGGEVTPHAEKGIEAAQVTALADLLTALDPYEEVPLNIQALLLRDQELDQPRAFPETIKELVALCLKSPHARAQPELDSQGTYYVLLNQHGWQLRDWSTLPHRGWERSFAQMIYGGQGLGPDLPLLEPLASYVSDPTIIFRVHEYGFGRLSVFAVLPRGVFLSGPVVIANEDCGLSAAQVRLLQQEVCFVDEAIRAPVTEIWYKKWEALRPVSRSE
jgi:hypothetical protein